MNITPNKSSLNSNNLALNFMNPKVDLKHISGFDEQGNPSNPIRLKEMDNFHFFAYDDKLIKNDSIISDSFILNRLPSIHDESSLIDFFNDYGFFFRSSKDMYALYSCDELLKLIVRIRYLIELINQINDDSPSYTAIATNMIQLMLSYPAKVHDLSFANNEKLIYISPEHQIRKNLISLKVLTTSPDFLFEDDAEPNPNCQYYLNNKYNDPRNYGYFDDLDDEMKVQHRFLDYIFSKNPISSIEFDNGVILSKSINIRPNTEEKQVILRTAKSIIKTEIDFHTKEINPVYDLDTMLGTWNIPNLITAVYFAIFFFNPKFKVIRQCANPTCNKFFDVLRTNKRKIYCDSICANTMSQRKYRAAKKQ